MNPTRLRLIAPLAFALLLLPLATTAQAQDDPDYVPEDTGGTKEFEPGWDIGLTIGANLNLSSNSSVIGQPDGASYTVGGNLQLAFDYFTEGGFEFRNRLGLRETFTRTPVLPEFVRTIDELDFEAITYYHFSTARWVGLFGRFVLRTSIFEGFAVQPEEVDFVITDLNGDTRTQTTDRLKLTDSFSPLTLKESVGGFLRPIDHKWIRLELRSGVGARQTFADDQLTLNDDPDTATIEVATLNSFTQIGLENVLMASGTGFGKRVTYTGTIETLTPFYNSDAQTDDRNAFGVTNVEVSAALSFKLVEWASLDYEFRALRQPALLDEFQIQHNLLLTFGYTLLDIDGQ